MTATASASPTAPDALGSVSAIVPFVNERASIQVLVQGLLGEPRSAIGEILIVVGTRTDAATLGELRELAARDAAGRIVICTQELPGLGGALREGVHRARGSHCLFIYADLESDPAAVPAMVAAARAQPGAVVSASRWLPGGCFEGYGRGKLVLNLLFQKLMAAAFRCRVTDFTFGFRLYPRRFLQSVAWVETRHPFVLESILVPVVGGVPVIEVPTIWRRRQEGQSSWSPMGYWSYLGTAWRIRFGPAPAVPAHRCQC